LDLHCPEQDVDLTATFVTEDDRMPGLKTRTRFSTPELAKVERRSMLGVRALWRVLLKVVFRACILQARNGAKARET
jgi:hypothetical protein